MPMGCSNRPILQRGVGIEEGERGQVQVCEESSAMAIVKLQHRWYEGGALWNSPTGLRRLLLEPDLGVHHLLEPNQEDPNGSSGGRPEERDIVSTTPNEALARRCSGGKAGVSPALTSA